MLQKHHTRISEVKYKELRKVEKKVHKRKKMAFLEDSLKELENLNNQNESQKFYKSVNKMRREFKPRTITGRNKKGDLVSEPP